MTTNKIMKFIGILILILAGITLGIFMESIYPGKQPPTAAFFLLNAVISIIAIVAGSVFIMHDLPDNKN